MNTEKKGHPAGLYLVFFTGMWERFSYYAMRGILVLYLTASWLNGGLGYDDEFSTTVYGLATGLCYSLLFLEAGSLIAIWDSVGPLL